MSKQILTNLDFVSAAKVINLPDPTLAQDAATKAYVDASIAGLSPKDSARVATQANISLSSPGATIDGITMAAGDRVLVRNQTTQSENGIYTWNGSAVALTRTFDANTANNLEQAIVAVEEGTDANTSWRQTTVNFTLGTGNVIFISFGSATPVASTTTSGTSAYATQSEVDAGTVANKTVTPATLAAYAGRIRKVSTNVGDGSATQVDFTHNLATNDTSVEVYRNTSPFDSVLCDIERPSTNIVRLRFAVAPATNAYRVVVIG